MTDLVADTHAALWYLRDPGKLSSVAVAAFQQAVTNGNTVFVPSISLVEICYLMEKARLPATAVDELAAVLTAADTPFAIAVLDLPVALAVEQIPRSQDPDMPDRIIAATALRLGIPLVTCDLQIRSVGIATLW